MHDAAAPAPRPTRRFVRHALVYGGLAGVLGGLWMIAEYALGFQTDRVEIGRWTSVAALVIPIGAVILGMMSWRNNVLGGRIRFAQAFAIALAIGLVFSVIIGGTAWLQAAKLSPELVSRRIDQQAHAAAQQPGADQEQIARQAAAAKAQATPGSYATVMLTFSLMQSLFVGLIAAITVPKKQPGLE